MRIIFLCLFSVSIFASQTIFVGVAGGSGSGKTTFAQKISSSPEIICISQDSYYKDISHLSFEDIEKTNFDHPDALDFDLLRKHLSDLKKGYPVEKPIYNFTTHARENQTVHIEPVKIVVVEGILLFAVPELRDLFDIKIYIDTADDIRLLRRIERDIKERSRNFESIKTQYLATAKKMHDTYVEPSKKFADLIISGTENNQVAIDVILAKLTSLNKE